MMAMKFQAKHKHRLEDRPEHQLDLVGHLIAVLQLQIPNLQEY